MKVVKICQKGTKKTCNTDIERHIEVYQAFDEFLSILDSQFLSDAGQFLSDAGQFLSEASQF